MAKPFDLGPDPIGHVIGDDGVTRVQFHGEQRPDGTMEYANVDPIHLAPGTSIIDLAGYDITSLPPMSSGDSLTIQGTITLGFDS